ncbi:dihydrofolate reductase family protein [Arthrobacter sp. BPSS-3]|uniref:dihydrofolate reductase family protein n=1 Tax=Arthrobacter sp. BPSS-3 TaxID=3366580 RepID=UPI0037DD0E7C
MRKIILSFQVSLDGFMEGPHADLSWHRVDAELHEHFNDQLRTMGAFLDGRITYELMAGFWPTADQDPDCPPAVADFAAIWREMTKYVYSRTLPKAGWNTTVVRDVDAGQVRALKAAPGGDLALGGAELADSFRRLGLIDEYWIYVHPVLVGRGTPLFKAAAAPTDLTLLETRTFGNGVVLLRYAANPDATDQSADDKTSDNETGARQP